MFHNRIFKVLGNLMLLVVFSAGQVAAAPNDAGEIKRNSSSTSVNAELPLAPKFTQQASMSPGDTIRVSVNSAGEEGGSNSSEYYPSISADGRYVAFISTASNLVSGDNNGYLDVFVRDIQTNTTTRVSVNSAGEEGNDMSINAQPSISADGRYVAFVSLASNLVSGDNNGYPDVFVRDTQTNTTTRVSINSAGEEGNYGYSQYHLTYPSISADGRYVAFGSLASNLVSGDNNGHDDIFVRDTQTNTTTCVSVNSAGETGYGESYHVSISADGRYVAFSSNADNLVSGDNNGYPDVFVRDTQTNTTTRVSVNSAGEEGDYYSDYYNDHPSISADGRYVAFTSWASNLINGDTNGAYDVFVRDTQTNTTTRVSVNSAGEEGNSYYHSHHSSISADGRYVAFISSAINLVSGDNNGWEDVFIRDTHANTTARVSVNSAGEEGNRESVSDSLSISANGQYVAFSSNASNLVSGDTNGGRDVFVHKNLFPLTNANLDNLVLSTGALSPVFAAGTITYTQSVTNDVTSLTVTPTVANAAATVTVNGTAVISGSASDPIALAVGANTITTVVTAEDGVTTKTYTVTVIRASELQDQGSLTYGVSYESTPNGNQHRWKLTASSSHQPLLFDVRPVSGGLTYSLLLKDSVGNVLVSTHSSADGRGIITWDSVSNGDYYVHIIPDLNSTGTYSITAWANSIPMIKFEWGEQTSYSNVRRWQSPLGATPLNFYIDFNRTAGDLEIDWQLVKRSNGAVLDSGASVNGHAIASGYNQSGYVDFYITGVSGDGSYRIGIYPGAAPLIVTNTNDSGSGSLRDTIARAGTGAAITFAPHLSGATIRLASTLILSKNVTIDGSALASQVTISGDTDNNGTGDVSVFYVNSGVTATLDSLIITKGATAGIGGGILNYGVLMTITDCVFSDNYAYYGGGGIYNGGGMIVTNSTISGNSSVFYGGGIAGMGDTLTVTNSTISGNSANKGGGVSNGGTMSLTDSTLSGNSAAYRGGGIDNGYSEAVLTVTNSTISDNSVSPLDGNIFTAKGGGIYNSGMLTVTDSALSDNSAYWGGGIYNYGGMATVMNSMLSGNSSTYDGGGIYNTGTLNVTSSTFSGNSADQMGGGIYNNYILNVTNSIFSGNSTAIWGGGGIYNSGTMIVTNSTLSGNFTGGGNTCDIYGCGIWGGIGGGIRNVGTLAITNSTLSGNSAAYFGGGIYNSGTLTVTNSTLSGNSTVAVYGNGGGIENSGGTLNYVNTIIANSSSNSDCADGGTIGTNANNLVEDGSCSAGGVNFKTGDPNLDALADNGGQTETMALLSGSPAINAGKDAACAASPVNNLDQRGVVRPQSGHCDIGAYEYVDTIAPAVTLFTVTSPSLILNPPITMFTASDNIGITGYMITESPTPPASNSVGWNRIAPKTYICKTSGVYTLYPWAKDAAGNVSAVFSSPVGINVTFVPPIYYSTALKDGWTLESKELSNVAGSKNNTDIALRVGDDALNRQYRSLLYFDTASLPNKAVITKATLSVRQNGTGTITTLGELVADIKKGFFGLNKLLELSDFNAAAEPVNTGKLIATIAEPDLYRLKINPLHFKYINVFGATQFRLRYTKDDNNDKIADFISFYSGDAAQANQPQLVIEYYVP